MILIASNTDILYAGYDELKKTVSSLMAVEQTVGEVRAQLSGASGMGAIQGLLQKAAGAIENETDALHELYRSLDMICQTYTSCEQRILARCEDTLIYYEQPQTEFVELASAASLLQELSFRIDGGIT